MFSGRHFIESMGTNRKGDFYLQFDDISVIIFLTLE